MGRVIRDFDILPACRLSSSVNSNGWSYHDRELRVKLGRKHINTSYFGVKGVSQFDLRLLLGMHHEQQAQGRKNHEISILNKGSSAETMVLTCVALL